MKTIEEVINMVEEWKDKQVETERLTEGLTNINYKVNVNGKSYVVRIPGENTDIFIDREVELCNTIAASEVGVGAHVIKYFKPEYIVIMEFLDGKVMSADSFKNHDYIAEAVKAIKKVNTEANFTSKFIMFEKFDNYLDIVKEHNIKIPKDFYKLHPVVKNVRDKFSKTMLNLVSCNNDLLAENFIEQNGNMRIIDWELSGLNDPCFELGDFAVEQGFGFPEDKLVIETYFGKFYEDKYARMNIYKYMADILWTLWASIQNHISNIDFDYWEYGMNRFNRAMNAIDSEEWENWLKSV
jgi:thiamine kinase-like enzyme